VQPYLYHVDRKGPFRLTVLLPPGLLREGLYEARIGLRVFVSDEPEKVPFFSPLRFQVEASAGGGAAPEDELDEDDIADDALAGDDSSLGESQTVAKPVLEWIVEPIPDQGSGRAALSA
jgi:hypothetical protein